MSFSVLGYDLTLSECITLFCSLFLSIFYAVKTHGLKNIIKEVLVMNYKFKTMQSVEPSEGQTFPTTKPEYRLNKATGRLEKTESEIDLQEIVNSCLETALDRVLDRLLPKVEEAKDIVELDTMRDDLDFAMEASNIAEDYRAKFKLPDYYSMEDIFAHVSKQANVLKDKIDNAKKQEVKVDETEKVDEKSK